MLLSSFFTDFAPCENFCNRYAKVKCLNINRLKPYLQIYRFADIFQRTLVYSIKDISIYIIYYLKNLQICKNCYTAYDYQPFTICRTFTDGLHFLNFKKVNCLSPLSPFLQIQIYQYLSSFGVQVLSTYPPLREISCQSQNRMNAYSIVKMLPE